MRITCKNKCKNSIYSPKKIVRNIKETEYKRCSTCYICIKWEGVYCPCCSIRLKVSPRNNGSRKRYSDNN